MEYVNFRPLGDMVLVKPDLPTHVGSIEIPETARSSAHQPGDYHDSYTGTVVAVGPGDRHKPIGSFYCSHCHQKHVWDPVWELFRCGCPRASLTKTAATKWNKGRFPMLVKLGDRVVYPRRPSMPGGEFGVKIGGQMYLMFHEEQFGMGILE